MNFVQRFWHLIKTGELQTVAGALSFATMLSFIPFIAVTLATIKYIDGISVIYPKAEALVLSYFQDPTGTQGAKILAKFFKRIQTANLGTWGFIGLVISSGMLVTNMERGIHIVWQLKTRRSLFHRITLSALIMILFPVVLAVYAGISSVKELATPMGPGQIQVYHALATSMIITFLYKILPNTKVNMAAALLGGFCTTIGLVLLYRSFKWITQSLFVFGKMYGSFAAIPTLLFWIFFTWMIILLGSMITASFHKNR